MSKILPAFALTIALGLAAVPALAQITIDADNTPLDTVLSQIAEQSGERIVAAPSASGNVTCKLKTSSAQEALSAVCATMGLEFKKVHLSLGDDETISGSDLEDIVSALEAVERLGVVVEGSKDAASLVFSRQKSLPQDLESLAPKEGRPLVPVYLVRRPTGDKVAAKRTPKVSELAEMEKERILAQSSLTEDERNELAKRNIDLFFSLDPQLRNNVMMDRMREMANMTPDQRRQMGEIMRNMWQQMPQDLQQRFGSTRGGRNRGNRPPQG
jgi:hypothetical protein